MNHESNSDAESNEQTYIDRYKNLSPIKRVMMMEKLKVKQASTDSRPCSSRCDRVANTISDEKNSNSYPSNMSSFDKRTSALRMRLTTNSIF